MNERIRILCADASDRAALVTFLSKNGYSVRWVRVKEKNTYKYFVEFWKESMT